MLGPAILCLHRSLSVMAGGCEEQKWGSELHGVLKVLLPFLLQMETKVMIHQPFVETI